MKPPDGHYHHNLWDIAEEHLGDGRRWNEIFELNKDRPQPDGGELVHRPADPARLGAGAAR